MADSPLSQADLEEALKARVTDLTDERDGLIDALIRAEEDRDEALAASRQPVCDGGYDCPAKDHVEGCYTGEGYPASRQPVSGGPEGDVVTEAIARVWTPETPPEAITAAVLAALSRVPADGEQPAGELYPSYPEHNEVDEAASRASRQERPPERMEDLIREGRMHAGDDVEERPPDLKVDLSPAFNAWQGEQPGLGDLQLTADQWAIVLDCATSYDLRLPVDQGSPEIPAVLRRLASRENPGEGAEDAT